jgi:hypothetical protein
MTDGILSEFPGKIPSYFHDRPFPCLIGKHEWDKWRVDSLLHAGKVFFRECKICDEIEVRRAER